MIEKFSDKDLEVAAFFENAKQTKFRKKIGLRKTYNITIEFFISQQKFVSYRKILVYI